MGAHHLKLVETTVQFLQFMTSIYVIVLTATGAAFYFYWTNKLNALKIKDLWPFIIPTGIVFVAFIFIGIAYRLLIEGLAAGIISKYMEFWFQYVGLALWLGLFLSIFFLLIAFVTAHKKAGR